MICAAHIKSFYYQNPIPNPINFTFTEKQVADGKFIDDNVSEQNFRHFSNLLNARIYKSAFKRHGKRLAVFVVREQDALHRHHLHGVIEQPAHVAQPAFLWMMSNLWRSTHFGYDEVHFEAPENEERCVGWIDYCLKKRSKAFYSDSIDWSNSTCFELR